FNVRRSLISGRVLRLAPGPGGSFCGTCVGFIAFELCVCGLTLPHCYIAHVRRAGDTKRWVSVALHRLPEMINTRGRKTFSNAPDATPSFNISRRRFLQSASAMAALAAFPALGADA